VDTVNRLLRDANALPQLTKHDGWDWHLHATAPDAPLADRMSTEAAMALADVIRSKEMDRLRTCESDDCDAAVLDLSRNRSKRYCDTGNCANRAHVAAYRARQAAAG
jgi:predicted RNA-binding Zn ribbon-like protein